MKLYLFCCRTITSFGSDAGILYGINSDHHLVLFSSNNEIIHVYDNTNIPDDVWTHLAFQVLIMYLIFSFKPNLLFLVFTQNPNSKSQKQTTNPILKFRDRKKVRLV